MCGFYLRNPSYLSFPLKNGAMLHIEASCEFEPGDAVGDETPFVCSDIDAVIAFPNGDYGCFPILTAVWSETDRDGSDPRIVVDYNTDDCTFSARDGEKGDEANAEKEKEIAERIDDAFGGPWNVFPKIQDSIFRFLKGHEKAILEALDAISKEARAAA